MAAVPDALLLVVASCPHCPAVLASLSAMAKDGDIGRLEVVNVAVHPEVAEALGVRSLPWVRIGPFELSGSRSRAEFEEWARRAGSAEGMADYFHTLLKDGELPRVRDMIAAEPALLSALLPIVANPEASINVRIGASVIFEAQAGSPALRALLPQLAELAAHGDARVRADACFYLGLSGAAEARPALQRCLADANGDVRDIATDALAELG
ncbi:MAG: HEAT repeat domain-containing protein [Gammaproteobacteria bacterium]|nr:HEAT repeat domain-containing protein [Gammaproteobacteria bacterium]MBU1645282.1 HEAT repeat domain-containing protein [Gammaproteobacteria bacterium]MBU1971619.1 HEAT repeat domain-containing protein [Gammaproteobacteria bacterium]